MPQSTYRLQLTPDFGFKQAAGLAGYLSALGITHLHASPYLQAAEGSSHGYDVADPGTVDAERGGETGRTVLCEALAAHGLGQVLDIVPNHMAVQTPRNRWWWDVLKRGEQSRYASFFDIDWNPPDPDMEGRVLLPILGDELDAVLREGALKVDEWHGAPVLRYYEHLMPLSPESIRGRGGEWETLQNEPEAMRRLIDRQHYLPACWKEASRRINYRRFFAINSLAGIRVEDEKVFDATHGTVLEWVREGCIDGLRIDHPDGLRDPRAYLERLARRCPSTWIVVEKILDVNEALPSEWPVAGTTGYDFLNAASGLFVDPRGESAMTRSYEEFTGQTQSEADLAHAKKRKLLADSFGSEVRKLTCLLAEILPGHGGGESQRRPREAVCEMIACFPVYRAYRAPSAGAVSEADREYIDTAADRARERLAPADRHLVETIRKVLLRERFTAAEREFVMRFQQLCAAATAKGVEDTLFYVYNRLVSLNEVGGDPGRFGVDTAWFHRFCRDRMAWPQTMNATSTHDTKRGADTRLRIHVLSEMPETWQAAVADWRDLNARFRRDGRPDRTTEYLLYQTLVGTWPIEVTRLTEYMIKAVREAKVYTDWEAVDPAYEAAVVGFVAEVLDHAPFIAKLEALLRPVVRCARVSSLAQTLLQLTVPGVPDIYRGTELWDESLVDPDNRRPVDFEVRRRFLAELDGMSPSDVLARMESGLPKLWVIREALRLRQARPSAFGAGADYSPLPVQGGKARNVVAFRRGAEIAAVVPRLVHGLRDGWRDTTVTLPRGRWKNVLGFNEAWTGDVAVDRLLEAFPVALLQREAVAA